MKGIKSIVIAGILLAASSAAAQSCSGNLSTNLGFFLPPHGCQAWDIPLNQNFNALDLYLSGHKKIPALAVSGFIQAGSVTVASLSTTYNSAPIGATVEVNDGQDVFDCSVGGGSAQIHACYCVAVSGGSCSSWLPVVGKAASATPGAVDKSINCGLSSVQSINPTTCAAAPGGGNGVLYQSGPTGNFVGDGTYKTLYTYTLPGGTLSATGGLNVTCYFKTVTGTGFPTSTFSFNSVDLPGFIGFTFSDYATEQMQIDWFNNGATNSQWDVSHAISQVPTILIGLSGSALDTTGDITISCMVRKSDGTFSGQGFIVNRIAQ